MSSFLFQVPLNERDLKIFRSPKSQPPFNPRNCGAVTGQLLGLVSPTTADQMTQLKQGVYPAEWVDYINNTIGNTLDFKRYNIGAFQSFFEKNLFPGFGTILAIYPKGFQGGHWFVMAKTLDNRLIVLDPQRRMGYYDIPAYFSSGSFTPVEFLVFLRETQRTPKQYENDSLAFLAKALETCNISSGEVYMDEDIPQSSKDVVMEGTGRRKRRKTKRRLVAKRTLRRVNRRRRIL